MTYKVHKIDVNKKDMQVKLEQFLNSLNGKVVSIIPNVSPTFQFMGATAKVDYVLVVEEIN